MTLLKGFVFLIPALLPAQIRFSHKSDTTVWLGDSITALGSANPTTPNDSLGSGWTAQAVILANGRIRQIHNAGIPDNTTSQILTRIQTDVVAYHPSKMVLLAGTNDAAEYGDAPMTDSQLQQTTSNIVEILQKAMAVGIQPIICTIPPRTDSINYKANAQRINMAIRNITTQLRIQLVDMYSVLADPNGDYKPGYNSDGGIHPTPLAAQVMAEQFIISTYRLYASFRETNLANVLDNGTFVGTRGWDGTGTAAAQLTVLSDGRLNWLRVSLNAAKPATYCFFGIADAIPLAVGHRYALSMRITTDGIIANRSHFQIAVFPTQTSSFDGILGFPNLVYQYQTDLVDNLFYMEFIAPVGFNAKPGIELDSGPNSSVTCSISITDVRLVDLTAETSAAVAASPIGRF